MADSFGNLAAAGILPPQRHSLRGVRGVVIPAVLVAAAILLAWIVRSTLDTGTLVACLIASVGLMACAATLTHVWQAPPIERPAAVAGAISLLAAAMSAPIVNLNNWSHYELSAASLVAIAGVSAWIAQVTSGDRPVRTESLWVGAVIAVVICAAVWLLQAADQLASPGSAAGPIALAAVAPLFSAGASSRQPISIALSVASASLVVLAVIVMPDYGLLLAAAGMITIGGLVGSHRALDDSPRELDVLWSQRQAWLPAIPLGLLLALSFGLDGSWRWLAVASFACVALVTISGLVVELVARERLLWRLTDLVRLTAHHARIDPLTRLPNRAALNARLDEEVERSIRYRHPTAVLFIDVDHFKSINDLLGHEAGDRALREIGGMIRATARTPDFVARFGGEEFVVIAPGTWAIDATVLGRRIQNAVGEAVQYADGGPVSVSVGIAGVPEHADSPEAVLRIADRALYRAKHAGRNRVEIADEAHDQERRDSS